MYHPNVHVKKTMQRAWNEYWSLKEAWEKKRKEKIEKINWRRTISNAISLNRVFYTKQEQQELDLR